MNTSRLPSLPIIALCMLGTAAAQPKMETSLETAMPAITPGVSHVNEDTEQGMGWRRTMDDRRDYGELFRAPTDFTANALAVEALYSDHFRGNNEAPFELEFLHFKDGTENGSVEVLHTFSGDLPPNVSIPPSDPAWMTLRFPKVAFEADQTYGFILRFISEGDRHQVILRVLPSSTEEGGYGLRSTDGQSYEKSPSMNFLLGTMDDSAAYQESAPPRVLLVDRQASEGFRTIAAAAAEARPGDTIRLKPGSGPYREIVHIEHSGTPEQPIVFDGSGETVTGFEPMTFVEEEGRWSFDLGAFLDSRPSIQGFQKVDGRWTSNIPGAVPAVLAHHGTRLFQDASTAQFGDKLRVTDDGRRLVLEPGVDAEGWEISARNFVFRILNASHQTYRNVRATGSLNDGFNLHGTGKELVFEDIVAAQNLDEGFSAHDSIVCRIDGGRFFQNDNGIGNAPGSDMTAANIEAFDNAGMGIWLLNCTAQLRDVAAWGNGVMQIALHGTSEVLLSQVAAARPAATDKPWLSYQESSQRKQSGWREMAPGAKVTGSVLELDATQHAAHP